MALLSLAGCSRDSIPIPSTWESAFSGTVTVEIDADRDAIVDFGADGPPDCVDDVEERRTLGKWANLGDGWYEVRFEDFTVEFTFDVWFDKVNFDKMYLSYCGDRDTSVLMARRD
ncbi:MAG: hypothetical protein CVT64_06940 [Actinobacteria bacterium HGW-Actinobacteria-4]|nr:MAG: hypothetical protein CVT64_06940 [Actinobacteria bacterium HGW-Actinobacteria-4]